MPENQTDGKSMTLKEVFDAAGRASQRVDRWPEWKRELACSTYVERQKKASGSSSNGSTG